MSPTDKLISPSCHDRRWKKDPKSQHLRLSTTETHGAGSTGAVLLLGARSPVGRLCCRRSGRRGRRCQGCFPGVLLKFHEFATLSRVDGENHSLLAVTGLAAVEPHWVRVFHGELRAREGLLVFGHWHTDRTRASQKLGRWTQRLNERLTTQCRIRRQGVSKAFRAWTVSRCGSSA